MNRRKRSPRRWSARVKTESTLSPRGLFNKDAAAIAKSLASKRVSPKGPGSGMRMLTFYINRAGHNLSPSRRKELERAKALLSKRIRSAKRRHSRCWKSAQIGNNNPDCVVIRCRHPNFHFSGSKSRLRIRNSRRSVKE